MTTTKTSRTTTAASAGTAGKPAVLFSDAASVVMSPLPGPVRSPLETLTWQEPPTLEEDELH
ncbi:hypothetical protein [Streptomyces sp. NPDC058861]|uniref:hypothetical protein n=1 Tax=Streptomyces sp. NPDC058861 TaxID=3346653 RepID=UPI00368F1F0D